MKCPACGASEVSFGIHDIPYLQAGVPTVIASVIGSWCGACGEGVVSGLEAARVGVEMMTLNRRKMQKSLDRHYIRQVRRKLVLDQRQAGEIFGGGANAFSRYESGSTKPPLALLKLLVLLDQHPELLREVYAEYRYISDRQC